MRHRIIVIESIVDVPNAGRYLRRESLTPDGDSIQVEYLPAPGPAAAAAAAASEAA